MRKSIISRKRQIQRRVLQNRFLCTRQTDTARLSKSLSWLPRQNKAKSGPSSMPLGTCGVAFFYEAALLPERFIVVRITFNSTFSENTRQSVFKRSENTEAEVLFSHGAQS